VAWRKKGAKKLIKSQMILCLLPGRAGLGNLHKINTIYFSFLYKYVEEKKRLCTTGISDFL
jgi:hypothetical protein